MSQFSDLIQLTAPDIVATSRVASEMGVVFERTSFSSLSEWTVSGATATVNNGAIDFSGGANNFNSYMLLNNFIDCDEKIKITVEYILNSATGGFGIGKKTVNTWLENSFHGKIDHGTGNLYEFEIYTSSTTPAATSGSTITNTVGHKYRFEYEINKWLIISTVTDVDTAQSITVNHVTSAPNTSQIALFNFGGSQSITKVKVERKSHLFPDIIFRGDSKTKGSSATAVGNRFADIVATNTGLLCEVWAGNGDRTVEAEHSIARVLAAKPKIVVMCLGRNDLASSVSYNLTKFNYKQEVLAYKKGNINVVHLLPIPEPSLSQVDYTTWISTNFKYDRKINLTTLGWNNGTMVSGDSIHPNNTGHAFIAGAIEDVLGY